MQILSPLKLLRSQNPAGLSCGSLGFLLHSSRSDHRFAAHRLSIDLKHDTHTIALKIPEEPFLKVTFR